MKKTSLLAAAIAAALGIAGAAQADEFAHAREHAVFVMTNDAYANEITAFERSGNGALHEAHSYRTGGRGSGGTIDPLISQGSLTLSRDGNWLFAVNAGSGTLSVFRVDGSRLFLTDQVPTGGSEPNAVAQSGNLVYVLNSAGSSNVIGFELKFGKLQPLRDSQRLLTANQSGSASISFSPNGKFLVVTERLSNSLDVFGVLPNGRLTELTNNDAAAPGTFAGAFAPNGTLVVSETGGGGANDSTVSSYSVQPNLALLPISAAVPTRGAANCWNAITPDGRFAYASNSATSSISAFAIAANGALSPIDHAAVVSQPAGSANLDIAISADGAFLYSLNSGSGSVGVFAIDKQSGALKDLGAIAGLHPAAGANGIAAS